MRNNFKIIIILHILFFTFPSCSNSREEKNVENVKEVLLGDSTKLVETKMGSKPDEIILDNEIYLNQELKTDITTYVYYTPHLSSSFIYFHFYEDRLIYIFHDI